MKSILFYPLQETTNGVTDSLNESVVVFEMSNVTAVY